MDESKKIKRLKNELLCLKTVVCNLPDRVGIVEAPEYTETIVNITPDTTTYSDGRPAVASGILAMGTTPIELLPAPGVGLYYDVDSIIFETTSTFGYSNATATYYKIEESTGYFKKINLSMLEENNNSITVIKDVYPSDVYGVQTVYENGSYFLKTNDNSNPTGGTGTLRAIITYTTRTFGA